jgi:hypothetical protein
LKFTTYGAYPFFYSISPFPILIFIFALPKLYIGGVEALEFELLLEPSALLEALAPGCPFLNAF